MLYLEALSLNFRVLTVKWVSKNLGTLLFNQYIIRAAS